MAKPNNIEETQLKESTLNGKSTKKIFPKTYAKCVKVVVITSNGSDGSVDLQTYLENLSKEVEKVGGNTFDIDLSNYPTKSELEKAVAGVVNSATIAAEEKANSVATQAAKDAVTAEKTAGNIPSAATVKQSVNEAISEKIADGTIPSTSTINTAASNAIQNAIDSGSIPTAANLKNSVKTAFNEGVEDGSITIPTPDLTAYCKKTDYYDKTTSDGKYVTKESAGATYLTQSSAASTYATKSELSSYAKTSDLTTIQSAITALQTKLNSITGNAGEVVYVGANNNLTSSSLLTFNATDGVLKANHFDEN